VGLVSGGHVVVAEASAPAMSLAEDIAERRRTRYEATEARIERSKNKVVEEINHKDRCREIAAIGDLRIREAQARATANAARDLAIAHHESAEELRRQLDTIPAIIPDADRVPVRAAAAPALMPLPVRIAISAGVSLVPVRAAPAPAAPVIVAAPAPAPVVPEIVAAPAPAPAAPVIVAAPAPVVPVIVAAPAPAAPVIINLDSDDEDEDQEQAVVPIRTGVRQQKAVGYKSMEISAVELSGDRYVNMVVRLNRVPVADVKSSLDSHFSASRKRGRD